MKNLIKKLMVISAGFVIVFADAQNQQATQIINQEACYAVAEPARQAVAPTRQVAFYYNANDDKNKVAQQRCPGSCAAAKMRWNGQTGSDAAVTDSRGRVYSTCICE